MQHACSAVHQAAGTERSPCPLVLLLPWSGCAELSAGPGSDFPALCCAESVAVAYVSYPAPLTAGQGQVLEVHGWGHRRAWT